MVLFRNQQICLLFIVKTADARQMGPRRTADEDFGTLLEAAVYYDRRVAALLGETDSSLDTYPTSSPFPRLLIVVTGMIFNMAHPWFV